MTESTTRRRRATVVLGLAVVALLVATWDPVGCRGNDAEPAPPAADRGPRPGETTAGRQAVRAPEPLPALPAEPDPEPVAKASEIPEVALRVDVGTWSFKGGSVSRSTMFRPAGFLPTRDEAPFPEDEDAAAILGLVGSHGAQNPDVLDALDDHPVYGRDAALPADPWAALLALVVAHQRADLAFHRDSEAWEARHDVPPYEDGEEAWRAARKAALAKEPGPKRGYADVAELAAEIEAAWPDHPVTDHAALYELEALANVQSDVRDDRALADRASDLLEGTDDALVQDQAAQALANVGLDAAPDDEALDVLYEIVHDPDAHVDRFSLAKLGMEASLDRGDVDRAADWAPTYDAITVDEVREARELSADAPFWGGFADTLGHERDAILSHLAALGTVPARTWREALLAAIRRCHADGHEAPEGFLTATGTWEDGWTWTDAEPAATPLMTCVRSAAATPTPDAPVRVKLTVGRH